MARKPKNPRKRRTTRSLDQRFTFDNDGVVVGKSGPLRPTQFTVYDTLTGQDRVLKLWRKTGTNADNDLRQLWRHEMRQVQRVMSYAGAHDLIVDVLEFVEDSDHFGVVLEHAGQPLSARLQRVARQHWLKNLGAPRSRTLFWRNVRRVVEAIGIVHAQGLVHGSISEENIMTEGSDEPDFQLSGFEWSLWLTAAKSDSTQAKIGADSSANRAERYSFAEDWGALGKLIAKCLGATVRKTGEVSHNETSDSPLELSISERLLLKRLVVPTRLDNLDAISISRSIDDLISEVGRISVSRSGTFILMFAQNAGLGDAVFDASNGDIPIDEYIEQLDWVRADLDGGAVLLIPRVFDPAIDTLHLVTSTMDYVLVPFRQDGAVAWDIAVCTRASSRQDALRIGDTIEHEVMQPIEVVGSSRRAVETRARLGPDALDWSAFGAPKYQSDVGKRHELVRQGLLLVQVIEAVIKALEIYPIQILDTEIVGSHRFAIVRADPGNERDNIAKRVGLTDSAAALKRLFEDDQRNSEAKWRFSQAASLGASRIGDVSASFVEIAEHRGRTAYRFEIDEDLPTENVLFLREEQDTGTEGVISRRLRNLKALASRVDLADMLDDPWRVRRSSREKLSASQKEEEHFKDLDVPKQAALHGLWSTLPSYFVVGPPGVGKTKLATEVLRRRFTEDPATRMLLTSQGHDALDHLQEKLKETLSENDMTDLIVVRSVSSDRRPTTEEDVHRSGLEYLQRLAESRLTQEAPVSLRERIRTLAEAATRLTKSIDAVEREDRIALNAVSSLVLDAANVVISTANSQDVERLVEAREQFDWVIVEEAAKATGPELVGPMMLSGRRLLIGDHHQLPPFQSERVVKALSNHDLVTRTIELAGQYVGPLMREGEINELELIAEEPSTLRSVADLALRLFEPFRTFVEEDERRQLGNPNHRTISSTLTEQRRMDPAIAKIVSKAFYDGKLHTHEERAERALKTPPFNVSHDLPAAPVVVIDFKHVSATKSVGPVESSRPRFHNPGEVEAIINVLSCIDAVDNYQPSLVILSPYKAQVEKITERIDGCLLNGSLKHLNSFRPALINSRWVSTVDGFQGNEADVVILSLVRNNSGAGASALGFLRDERRMNVALSRAKSKLVIVGSLAFLREAVRGVNPDDGEHNLQFLSRVIDTIEELCRQTSDSGVPRAQIIPAESFSGGGT